MRLPHPPTPAETPGLARPAATRPLRAVATRLACAAATGLACAALLAPGPARAAPIKDPAPWVQRFAAAAAANDAVRITEAVNEVAHPSVPKDRVAEAIRTVVNQLGGRPTHYAEVFGHEQVGTFLDRSRVAVNVGEGFLFYGVDLARFKDGWQLVNITITGNLDELMKQPLPLK